MIRPVYSVWCDSPGCCQWEGQEPTRALAWAYAKRRGWVSRKVDGFRVTICRDCLEREG